MSHEGQDNQGTGLRDVFDVLVKAPAERLRSLTFQLNESPEDNIVHALCLFILQKEVQALNKLQTLRDNPLAKHLAEKWYMSAGKLEDFALHCGNVQEFTGESLAVLARIFKVLSQQRLCDQLLRNLAYKRALSSDNQKTSNFEDLEYDLLKEEAKDVCGPQFVEWICSPTELKSESYSDQEGLDEGNTSLKVTLSKDQQETAHSLQSPPQTSSSMPSYPTHLEISTPPTVLFQDDKRTPETSDKSTVNIPISLVSEYEGRNAPAQPLTSVEPQLKSSEPPAAKRPTRLDEMIDAKSHISIIQTSKPTAEPKSVLPTATSSFPPKVLVANEIHERNSADEEEEATFYAFVILHAPEDADMAESMRERMEKIIGSIGATFSDDFATPGKSTLRCVEDAINNTAFTLLLLTRNFNTRMLEMETDSALINSVNKKHKYNTVIPLLPRENCMPKQSLPTVLQTIVPLEESRSFERKLQRSMSPAKIKRQKDIWTEEQRVKMQIERQERLKQLNQHHKQLIKECHTAHFLEREHLNLLMEQKLVLNANVPPEQNGADGRTWWQQQPNIHIEHAKYIMIGNDSQMTVGLGGGAAQEDSVCGEDEQ